MALGVLMQDLDKFMAETNRKQALTVLRGYRSKAPVGWTQEMWDDMLRKIVEDARKAGVTDEEIKALGINAP